MIETIKRKYYTTREISKEVKLPSANLQYWLSNGLLEVVGVISTRGGKGRRYYTPYQFYCFKRMARLMATGFYTVKGAIQVMSTDVEIPEKADPVGIYK